MRALAVCGLVAIGLLAATVVLAATPNDPQPGQRIDLKVLLLSADGTEPGFAAWKAELDREGVPYDTLVAFNGQTRAATLTDAQLADYGANHAKYQAVILAGGDLGHVVNNPGGTTSFLSAFTDAEWTALARFERTFGIRRLSDFTAPSPLHGLNVVGGGDRRRHPGHADRRRQGRLPVPQGPDPVPERRAERCRGVRLPGHARERRRLADARRGARPPAPRTSASTRTRTTGARRW